jgi:hypothetical protein
LMSRRPSVFTNTKNKQNKFTNINTNKFIQSMQTYIQQYIITHKEITSFRGQAAFQHLSCGWICILLPPETKKQTHKSHNYWNTNKRIWPAFLFLPYVVNPHSLHKLCMSAFGGIQPHATTGTKPEVLTVSGTRSIPCGRNRGCVIGGGTMWGTPVPGPWP